MDGFTIAGIGFALAPAAISVFVLGLWVVDRSGFRSEVPAAVERIGLLAFAALVLLGDILLAIGSVR